MLIANGTSVNRYDPFGVAYLGSVIFFYKHAIPSVLKSTTRIIYDAKNLRLRITESEGFKCL
jgi:hypothetical protein